MVPRVPQPRLPTSYQYGLPRRNRGVALITVMMILALMTTFMAYMVEDNHLSIRRITNQADIEAAHQLAIGGEQVAVNRLQDDLAVDSRSNNGAKDYFGEAWSLPINDIKKAAAARNFECLPKPKYILSNERLGEGTVSVIIYDAAARFNLNNIAIKVQSPSNPSLPPKLPYRDAFVKLLHVLEINQNAEEFAAAVVDWLDQDVGASGLHGAEDDHYLGLDAPYRTGNTAFSDISELKLVKGFDEIDAAKQKALLSLVSALPIGYTAQPQDAVPINLHTAPPELISLLSTQNSGPDVPLASADLKAMLTAREEQCPFQNAADFADEIAGSGQGINFFVPQTQQPTNKQPTEAQVIEQLFDVRSQFFEVVTTVKYGRFDYKLTSLVRRYDPVVGGQGQPTPNVGVIRRTRQLNVPNKKS